MRLHRRRFGQVETLDQRLMLTCQGSFDVGGRISAPSGGVPGVRVELLVDENGDGQLDPVDLVERFTLSSSGDLPGSVLGEYCFEDVEPSLSYWVRVPAQSVAGEQWSEQVTQLFSTGQPSLLIDGFSTTQSVAAFPPPVSNNSNSLQTSESEVIGGERDLAVELSEGAGEVQLRVNPFGLEANLLFDSAGGTRGLRQVTWDGRDADGDTLALGLGDLDLSVLGSAFILRGGADLNGGVGILRVYSDSLTSFSEQSFALPQTGGNPTRFFAVPFEGFVGTADLSNVDAIQLLIETTSDSVDGAIGFVGIGGARTFNLSNDIVVDQFDVVFSEQVLAPSDNVFVGTFDTGQEESVVEFTVINRLDTTLSLGPFEIAGQFRFVNPITSITLNPQESRTISVEADVFRAGVKSGSLRIGTSLGDTRNFGLQSNTVDTLFLSFDEYDIGGRELLGWSKDWVEKPNIAIDRAGDGVTVSAFRDGKEDREEVISKIMELVAFDVEQFNIRVKRLLATDSVEDSKGFTTVFVGPADIDVQRHVASDIDKQNRNDVDIAFVLEEDWGTADRTAQAMANVIIHEAGHTWGLEHVEVLLDTDAEGKTKFEAMALGNRIPLRDATFLPLPATILDSSGRTQNSFETLKALFELVRTGTAPVPPLIDLGFPGDLDGNDVVNFQDFVILATNFGKETDEPKEGDINGDGRVTFADFVVLAQNFGKIKPPQRFVEQPLPFTPLP